MRFRHFILLEQDPMGGAPGGDPMGGGMGGPPMGGDPMGGGPPPGMGSGGDPMGGGMGGPPMGGAAPTPPEPQPIPQHADVWTVLDSILNGNPIAQEEKLKKYQSQKSQLSDQNASPPPGGPPPGMGSGGDPMGGGMGGPALMS
jgi:hypothetical protein